jgi:hypothetical protein
MNRRIGSTFKSMVFLLMKLKKRSSMKGGSFFLMRNIQRAKKGIFALENAKEVLPP